MEIQIDRSTCHSPPKKQPTLVSRTADYTSGDQNLEKTMLDNEIASMDHYWEPNKFGVSFLMM